MASRLRRFRAAMDAARAVLDSTRPLAFANGEQRVVHCKIRPSDFAVVLSAPATRAVMLAFGDGTPDTRTVAMDARHARMVGAWLLDAADNIDGLQPALFSELMERQQ